MGYQRRVHGDCTEGTLDLSLRTTRLRIFCSYFLPYSFYVPNLITPSCVNVSLSTSVKLVSRSVTPAGNCTAWSMESNLMVRCHLTNRLEVVILFQHLLLRNRFRQARPSCRLCRLGTHRRRCSPYRYLQATFPSRTTDHRQGRCRQQLRSRSLHHRQGDRRPGPRPSAQALRPVHRTSRIPHLSLFWWRYRIRIHFVVDGASVCRLRKEIQTGIRHLPCPPSLHCRC